MPLRARPIRRAGVLAAVLLAGCGSRNIVAPADSPTETSPAQASAVPSPTPNHTPAAISDPRSLGANRVTLARRTAADGVYASPILVVLEHSNVPAGQTYQAGAWTGFTYVSEGTLGLDTSATSVDVHAGEGRVIPTGSWEQLNPGPAPSTYYVLGVRDNTERDEWGGWRVLASPPIDLPHEVAYQLRLDVVTIGAGGRTESQVHGGAEAIVVLEGAVEVREPNANHSFVATRTCIYVPPQTAVQLFALDAKPARLLEFFYTPDDRPFAVGLDSSP